MKNTDCCPELDPELWDKKTHSWKNKLFLRDEVFQIIHIPLNMSSVVNRMFKKIEKANVSVDPKEFLMLCHDPSPWKSEIYMTIKREIDNEKIAKLTGTFVSLVFDGPYNYVPVWIKEMDKYLASRKKKSLKYYFHFSYCPKCAKKYGHNYCVAFAQIN